MFDVVVDVAVVRIVFVVVDGVRADVLGFVVAGTIEVAAAAATVPFPVFPVAIANPVAVVFSSCFSSSLMGKLLVGIVSYGP